MYRLVERLSFYRYPRVFFFFIARKIISPTRPLVDRPFEVSGLLSFSMTLDVLDNIKGTDLAAKNVITASVNFYFKWAWVSGCYHPR